MKDPIAKEVYDVLSADSDTIPFETVTSEEDSPLNQAVKEQHGKGQNKPKNWNVWKPEDDADMANLEREQEAPEFEQTPLDAPEQQIYERQFGAAEQDNTQQSKEGEPEEVFELPTATAKQAADTILGMSNNVLAVGGGFFIKIRKHKDFYEFDEIVELIDTQNEKNVRRIQLDKDDKALLKPLLVAILKKKAKNLTPEQQLMGAVLSILIKKAQVVMEVRAENDILVDRILDIVREERGTTDSEESKQEDIVGTEEAPEMDFTQMQADANAIIEAQPEKEVVPEAYDEDLYTDVVEVFDATPKDQEND